MVEILSDKQLKGIKEGIKQSILERNSEDSILWVIKNYKSQEGTDIDNALKNQYETISIKETPYNIYKKNLLPYFKNEEQFKKFITSKEFYDIYMEIWYELIKTYKKGDKQKMNEPFDINKIIKFNETLGKFPYYTQEKEAKIISFMTEEGQQIVIGDWVFVERYDQLSLIVGIRRDKSSGEIQLLTLTDEDGFFFYYEIKSSDEISGKENNYKEGWNRIPQEIKDNLKKAEELFSNRANIDKINRETKWREIDFELIEQPKKTKTKQKSKKINITKIIQDFISVLDDYPYEQSDPIIHYFYDSLYDYEKELLKLDVYDKILPLMKKVDLNNDDMKKVNFVFDFAFEGEDYQALGVWNTIDSESEMKIKIHKKLLKDIYKLDKLKEVEFYENWKKDEYDSKNLNEILCRPSLSKGYLSISKIKEDAPAWKKGISEIMVSINTKYTLETKTFGNIEKALDYAKEMMELDNSKAKKIEESEPIKEETKKEQIDLSVIREDIAKELLVRFKQIQKTTKLELTLGDDIIEEAVGKNLHNIAIPIYYVKSGRKHKNYLNFTQSQTFKTSIPEFNDLRIKDHSKFREFINSIRKELLFQIESKNKPLPKKDQEIIINPQITLEERNDKQLEEIAKYYFEDEKKAEKHLKDYLHERLYTISDEKIEKCVYSITSTYWEDVQDANIRREDLNEYIKILKEAINKETKYYEETHLEIEKGTLNFFLKGDSVLSWWFGLTKSNYKRLEQLSESKTLPESDLNQARRMLKKANDTKIVAEMEAKSLSVDEIEYIADKIYEDGQIKNISKQLIVMEDSLKDYKDDYESAKEMRLSKETIKQRKENYKNYKAEFENNQERLEELKASLKAQLTHDLKGQNNWKLDKEATNQFLNYMDENFDYVQWWDNTTEGKRRKLLDYVIHNNDMTDLYADHVSTLKFSEFVKEEDLYRVIYKKTTDISLFFSLIMNQTRGLLISIKENKVSISDNHLKSFWNKKKKKGDINDYIFYLLKHHHKTSESYKKVTKELRDSTWDELSQSRKERIKKGLITFRELLII